jgi:diguanylate cyclase (GGDEF)-like protein
MLTRVAGNDWIVLQAEDHGYGVAEGTVFHWLDSFCSEMVQGNGPYIAVNSQAVPAYVQAPINQQVKIGAYIGMPLRLSDGSLFGTLCAIHPDPVAAEIEVELSLIEVLARLLSSLLDAELKTQQQLRRAERAEIEALTDALTGLYNRRGWDNLVAAEERRCQSYGYSASVIAIDIDNLKDVNDTLGHAAGDRLIKRLARVLTTLLRKEDVAARVGGDEFTVLAVEIDEAGATALVERLSETLTAAGVKASIGMAMRVPSQGLAIAGQKADALMYCQKQAKKAELFHHIKQLPPVTSQLSPSLQNL